MEISLSNIGKQYGNHWVFQNLDHLFESNHTYPIIGSNGSGKSTLLQIISGFITANEGEVVHSSNGQSIPIEDWYKHQSMATPYLDLFEEFNVRETVLLHKKLKPLRLEDEALMDQIDLNDHSEKPLKALSSGMKQRLKLALAIWSDTPVLLLDEPTSNLDQNWSKWFQESLKSNQEGRLTIICTNSQPAELEVCDAEPINLTH